VPSSANSETMSSVVISASIAAPSRHVRSRHS
jgi:hypothetical protein